MNRYRIAVIAGSLRKDSFNRRLGSALARLAPPDFSFQLVRRSAASAYGVYLALADAGSEGVVDRRMAQGALRSHRRDSSGVSNLPVIPTTALSSSRASVVAGSSRLTFPALI